MRVTYCNLQAQQRLHTITNNLAKYIWIEYVFQTVKTFKILHALSQVYILTKRNSQSHKNTAGGLYVHSKPPHQIINPCNKKVKPSSSVYLDERF